MYLGTGSGRTGSLASRGCAGVASISIGDCSDQRTSPEAVVNACRPGRQKDQKTDQDGVC